MKTGVRQLYYFLGFGILFGTEQGLLLSESLFMLFGFKRLPNDAFDIAMLVALAITFIVLALMSSNPRWQHSHLPPLACVIFIISGIALIPISVGTGLSILTSLGGIMSGIGFASLILSWQELFLHMKQASRGIAFGIAFFALFITTYSLVALPSEIALVLVFIYPLSSAVLIARGRQVCWKKGQPSDSYNHPDKGSFLDYLMLPRFARSPLNTDISRPRLNLPSFLRKTLGSFVCLAAFAIVFGIVGQIAIIGPSGFGYASVMTAVAMGISSILFFFVVTLFYRLIDPASAYRVIFPIALLALFLLPFLGSENWAIINGFIVGGFFFVSFAFMCLVSNEISQNHLIPNQINGFTRGIEVVLSLIGVLIGTTLTNDAGYTFIQTVTVVFVCVYLLSMALLFLSRQEKKQSSVIPFAANRNVAKQTSEKPGTASSPQTSNDLVTKCTRCAKKYALTRRETEILVYLAKGRSSAYISETLVVSNNTVKGHVKNIYTKTAVHSKQDLLDLIENS